MATRDSSGWLASRPRTSTTYGTRRVQHTQARQVTIGERRRPGPQSRPGYLRVDTVHQGHHDGKPSVYHNLRLKDLSTLLDHRQPGRAKSTWRKLLGTERKSHVMDLIFNPAIALFAGLNVVPKTQLSGGLQLTGEPPRQRAAEGCLVRATGAEPLEKHFVSSRSRRLQSILVFLARHAGQRVFCYANADIPKVEQSDEILRSIELWERHTGTQPAELIFDSQLTTHEDLSELEPAGNWFHYAAAPFAKDVGRHLPPPASAGHPMLGQP